MHKHFLLITFILLFLLSGCGLFGGSRTPTDVVDLFMTAMDEQRLDDAADLMTPAYHQTYLAGCQAATLTECSQKAYAQQGALTYKIVGSQINGETATVTIRTQRERPAVPVCSQFTLTKNKGSWQISDYRAWICQ